MVVVVTVRATVNPRLVDVNGGRVVDGLALSVLESDGDGLLVGGLALDGSQTHTGTHHGDVLSMLEVLEDLLGGLLLAQTHLQHGIVDVLASDLTSKRTQLLDGGLEPMGLGEGLTLRPHDQLGGRDAAATTDLASNHLLFPARARLGVRVQHCLHRLPVSSVNGIVDLFLALLGGTCLLASSGRTAGGHQFGAGFILCEDRVGAQGTLAFGGSGGAASFGLGGAGLAAEEEVLDRGQGGGLRFGLGLVIGAVGAVFGGLTRNSVGQCAARDVGQAGPG